MNTQPAAGWYPDPTAQSLQRWWDGSAWSQVTRPAWSAGTGATPDYLPAATSPYGTAATPGFVPVATNTYAPVATNPYVPVATNPYAPVATNPYGAGATNPYGAGAARPSRRGRIALWSLVALLVAGALVAGGGLLISRVGSAISNAAGTKASGAPSPTGPTTADVAAEAEQLGGTPFVSSDGVVSLVVPPKWTPVDVPSDAAAVPRVIWQQLWFLGSGDQGFNDMAILATEKIPSLVNLDAYMIGGRVSLKREVDNFVLLSEKRARNAYGQEADILIYKGAKNGVANATMNYTVVGHGVAMLVAVTSSPDRIDEVVAREMPFISTLTAK